ncbi:Aste57867_15474 [Aphanomyces stellatus]|uniref:Aste57867_15474 protein n=1 Tax=Aphanomyces stellatus TaxID=120398 RepID=A0A485L3T0_9STRA|nr:hypothetical protein As57867_015418 [Aphanomyces stellatus]VFT92276.1 Aste57867_15474 [Aphanomyces stellatus]
MLLRQRKLSAKEKLLLAQGGTHTTVLDVLSRKLKSKLEELIPIENERQDKAFRLFTSTDGITPQGFHALLLKFRITANRQQSYALFHKYDVDCKGVLDRSKFLHGVFQLGNMRRKAHARVPPDEDGDANSVHTHHPQRRPSGVTARSDTVHEPPRPDPHGSHNTSHIHITNVQTPRPAAAAVPVTDRLAHKPMLTHHHPAREQHETPLGENLPFEEIVKRIRDKIDQRTSKASDRFRQAFKIFGKASGITPAEFHEGLLALGFRVTLDQNSQLFQTFDVNKSGDLDLNEFVQGISLDDSSIKYIQAHVERQRREEARRKRYQLAVASVEQAWSIEDMERKLREKIEQHTSKSSDCFRQAFKIFKKSCGIKPQEFHDALAEMGLDLPRVYTDRLFAKYDTDGSGDIDLPEFVRGVLPADYTGGTWVAEADEMHRVEAEAKKLKPDSHLNRISVPDWWSLDTIQMKVREKITQKTTKSSDTFRQVYRIFQKSSGITMAEFRQALLVLGFRLNDTQVQGLFNRYDTDRSHTIDLTEFCRHVLPPDYNGDGDHWGHTDEEHKQKAKDAILYAKLTKNGTEPIPTPPLMRPGDDDKSGSRPQSAPQVRPSSAESRRSSSSSRAESATAASPRRPRPSHRDDQSRRPLTPSKPDQRPTSARPASARPAPASGHRPPTPRPMSARSTTTQQPYGAPAPGIRPASAASCSSSSSVTIKDNPFKSKRRHFFHHHNLWQRKVQFMQAQAPKEGDKDQPSPEKEVETYDDIAIDDDDDDEDAFEDDHAPYEELRTPVKPRPASARPATTTAAPKMPARPPSASLARPQTSASTASVNSSHASSRSSHSNNSSRRSHSPRHARMMSETSSQSASQTTTDCCGGGAREKSPHRAKFKGRIYGPGFKKMFLQMAQEKLLADKGKKR